MQFSTSYCLVRTSPLPLDVGYLFLVGFNILLSMVVQQLVAILEFSREEMSTRPTPPICVKSSYKDKIVNAYKNCIHICS